MAAGAILLILASAFLHAVWNALLKRLREERVRPGTAAMMVVAAASAWLAVPFSGGAPFPSASAVLWGLGAGIGESGYFLTLALALRQAPLGLAYSVARGGAILLV